MTTRRSARIRQQSGSIQENSEKIQVPEITSSNQDNLEVWSGPVFLKCRNYLISFHTITDMFGMEIDLHA